MKVIMLVKNVFMELRTRLRSCNVYITTTVDFKSNCNLKVSIQANSIVLSYYSEPLKRRDSISSIDSLSDCYSDDDSDTTVISVQEFCQIIPNSMSGLKVDRNNISFRVLTESAEGSFYTERLAAESTKAKPSKADLMKINIKANENVLLSCQNCSNVISEGSIQFGRVLELPTSNLDMSEWFCHNHSDHSPTTTTVITPNKTDFLYRLTYFIVDFSLLSQKTNKFNLKRDVYHCNRCLAWLGLKTNDAVKLFNSTVNMNETQILKSKLQTELPTNDFIYTVESMIKEFDIGFQYTIMCKIVLSCIMTPTHTQYLLIWVMDKALQVLQNSSASDVTLRSSLQTKLLYKVADNLNEEVQSWLDDPAVVTSEVSKQMYCSGHEHLLTMSRVVPEPFRTTNGYTISYLKL